MSQLHYTLKSKKGQHLTYTERRQIEILLKAGHKAKEIANLLGGRSERTIRREIVRGTVELLNSDYATRKEYSADAAQSDYDKKAAAKGSKLKIGKNFALVEFMENINVKEKYSPYSALEEAKNQNLLVNICLKTLYNYNADFMKSHYSLKDRIATLKAENAELLDKK